MRRGSHQSGPASSLRLRPARAVRTAFPHLSRCAPIGCVPTRTKTTRGMARRVGADEGGVSRGTVGQTGWGFFIADRHRCLRRGPNRHKTRTMRVRDGELSCGLGRHACTLGRVCGRNKTLRPSQGSVRSALSPVDGLLDARTGASAFSPIAARSGSG